MKLAIGTMVLALALASGCGGTETPTEEPTAATEPTPPPGGFLSVPGEASHRGVEGLPDVDPIDTWGPESKPERVVHINRGGTLAIQGDAMLDKAMARDFTLEFWINIATSNNKTIMQSKGLHLLTRKNQLLVHLNGVYVKGPTLKINEWYHIALSVQTDRLKVFVNGRRAANDRLGENLERPVGALVFGGDRNAPLVGYLDNIRLIRGVHYKTNFLISQTFKPADAEFAYDFNSSAKDPVDLTGNGRIIRLAGETKIVEGKL